MHKSDVVTMTRSAAAASTPARHRQSPPPGRDRQNGVPSARVRKCKHAAINARQRRDKGREPVANTSSSHGSQVPRCAAALHNIDFIHRLARPQARPVPGVPLRRQQRICAAVFHRQHRRELDAVIGMRGSSPMTVMANARRALGERGNQPGGRHAIADNDQSHHAASLRRFRLFFIEEMEDLLAQW
jgi:hypothetical protein